MKCSICKQKGHNKRNCKISTEKIVDSLDISALSLSENDSELKLPSNPHDIAISIINKQKEKEENNNIWKNSKFQDLVKLQSNNVGIVGEELINNLCKLANILANLNGVKTKQIGGGNGDGEIMGKTVEIKTAMQGSKTTSFQHELGEVPWKANYMLFNDFAPNCIYITIFQNIDEHTYKNDKKIPCFPTKKITWRKHTGAFKLDTSIIINEKNITNGNCIKIKPDTKIEDFAAFIRSRIV